MLKNINEILSEVQKFDHDEYDYIYSNYIEEDKNPDMKLLIGDKLSEICESISEFGYRGDTKQEAYACALEWFKLALKYKYYKDLNECLVDIWQNSFGLWVDENQRGNLNRFNSIEYLKEIKEYLYDVYNLTSKLTRWWIEKDELE